MHHPLSVKSKVRKLRIKGYSLSEINQQTGIPITTIRTWISDIRLTKKQQEKLARKVQKVLQAGRVKAQKLQKDIRDRKERELRIRGKKDIGKLSLRDIFIAGVTLYWAEGFKNKHERRLGFCNSDPKLMKFYINWLEKALKIKRENLIARLTLNSLYKNKTGEIEEYWSRVTGIHLGQFTKAFYQNSVWKKQFNTDNYKGVLRVHVKDSLENLLKMRGWLEGLAGL